MTPKANLTNECVQIGVEGLCGAYMQVIMLAIGPTLVGGLLCADPITTSG